MIIVDTALQKLHREKKPIRVGLVGAGYAARGFALQLLTNGVGMKLVAISNRTIAKAETIYKNSGVNAQIIKTKDELDQFIENGEYVVTDNADLLCESEQIDVIVEATGDVEFGSRIALKTIENKKHIVLINAELDSTVGPILKQYADRQGVVYTQADGDQPAVIMNLFRYVESLGFTPVVAGNIKSILDHERTPETQKKWAEANGQSPLLATTAADGTKIAMEMATVANATGLKSGVRGMYGPECIRVENAIKKFPVDKLLQEGGIVDYIIGAEPSFGIFIIAHSDNPTKQEYMKMYKMGDGPFYTFYTPYHLCTLESPLSVARAFLFKDAALAPLGGPVCDVITLAKRDLKSGETLDGIGGFTCYGNLENYDLSIKENLLPMGLAKDCVLKKDIKKGKVISYDDVVLPKNRISDKLRRAQTKLFSLNIYEKIN